MGLGIILFGVIGLLFRVWLVEFEVRKELDYRKHYLSRLINYYFFIGLIFDNQLMVFNLITVTVIPVLFIAFFAWDFKWFKRFKTYNISKRKKFWLFVERLTLHVPILITGLYFYITGFKEYVLGSCISSTSWCAIISYFLAGAVNFIPFILLDVRITKKHKWPTGKYMLMGMVFFMTVYYLIVILTPDPVI